MGVAAAGLAQSSEEGQIQRVGSQSTLTINSPRPLDSAAMTLAQHFGINVSVEDPPYIFQDDVKDVTAEVARASNPTRRVLIPKGGRLEITFPVGADGLPADPELLEKLVQQANAQYPFAYRLDDTGGFHTLIPTRMRDALGHAIGITPLLDRRVTIPLGTRTIAETANLMTAALSAQTGLQVSCCQGVIVGIPWGLSTISFQAQDEPARSVLIRLITADLQGKPNHYYWLQRCDPLPSKWCFINLNYARTLEPK
jgi:hypothetical protein